MTSRRRSDARLTVLFFKRPAEIRISFTAYEGETGDGAISKTINGLCLGAFSVTLVVGGNLDCGRGDICS